MSNQLLSVLGVGFAQGLYALDVADGESDNGFIVSSRLEARYFVLYVDRSSMCLCKDCWRGL